MRQISTPFSLFLQKVSDFFPLKIVDFLLTFSLRQDRNPSICEDFPSCPYYRVLAHFCNSLPAKWGGCKDPVQYFRPLLRRFHPGHLHPRHSEDATGRGGHHRQRHRPGDVIIRQKKRRPGRGSPPGPVSVEKTCLDRLTLPPCDSKSPGKSSVPIKIELP